MARISFPFGLKKEAEIYCRASKLGLSTDPNAPKIISEMADNLTNSEIMSFSKEEVLDAIAIWTRDVVKKTNDETEDNVAWWIALYCCSVIKAMTTNNTFTYDEIFKYAFINYYTKFNN